jgi:hypothetical protein
MKQKLNYLFSLFCVLLFFSCTEEKDYIEKSSSGSFKKISFEEFQKNTNAMRTFNVIETKTKMAKSSQRIIFDSINNFSIDTDKIIIAEKDGKICYTILIERPYATSITENLVLKEVENGLYIPFILEYDFNDLDKEKAYNLEFIPDLNSKLTILKPEVLDLDDFVETNNVVGQCTYVYVLYCTCNQHSGDLTGCECIGLNVSQQCDNGGGNDFGNTTSSDGPIGIGASGGGGGSTNSGSPNPNNPPPPNNNTANQNQIITLPLVDLEEEVELTPPCAELNVKSNETEFNEKLHYLKKDSVLNLDYEKGFLESRDFSNTQNLNQPVYITKSGSPMNRTIDILPSDNCVGYMHSHNNNYYAPGISGLQITVKMFSYSDLYSLFNTKELAISKNLPISETFGIMVSSAGTYALKFLNSSVPNLTDYQKSFAKRAFNKLAVENEQGITHTQAQIEIFFLKLLKDLNLQNQVGLYNANFAKITSSNPKPVATWSKLVISANNTYVTKQPCNN